MSVMLFRLSVPVAALLLAVGIAQATVDYTLSPSSNGPAAGGNVLLITNCTAVIGSGNITNVVFSNATQAASTTNILGQSTNWVKIVVPAHVAGAVSMVVQDLTDTLLTNHPYIYNPPGRIYPNIPQGWSETVGLPGGDTRWRAVCGVLDNVLYVVAGNRGGYLVTNTLSFDGGAVWTEAPGLPMAMSKAAGGVFNGALYNIGGDTNATVTNVFRFNGSSWTETAGLPAARFAHCAGVLNGYLYAFGGSLGNDANTNVYRFDGTNWMEVAGMPTSRLDQVAGILNDRLYAIGGSGYTNTTAATMTNVYRFDGTNWTETVGLPVPLSQAAGGEINGRLYVVGGYTNATTPVARTNMYRFDGTNWIEVAGMPGARIASAAGIIDGTLFIVSGYDSSYRTNVYQYRPDSGLVGVVPVSGSCTGGYTVAIYGTNLGNGTDITNVTLCGVAVSNIQSQTPTSVVVTAASTPIPGLGDVCVYSTSYGRSALANYFTYTGLLIFGTNNAVITNGESAAADKGTDFGHVYGWGCTNTFSITNNGATAITISGVTTGGTGAASFQALGMPASISSGTASNLSIAFNPPTVGSYTCVVSITHDSAFVPYILNFKGATYQTSTNNGPAAGGNYLTITNGTLGNGSDITNVLVGGTSATIVDQGANWVRIILPAHAAGTVDIVIQSASVGQTSLTQTYTYNPAGFIGTAASWTYVADMPYKAAYMGYGVLSNQLYSIGGVNGTVATNVLQFNGTNWIEIAGLPGGSLSRRYYLPAAELNGSLYAVGGRYSSSTTNVFRYDGIYWNQTPGLPAARMYHAAAVLNGNLYAIGGSYSGTALTNVYCFNGTNWSEVSGLSTALVQIAAATYRGAIYTIGGLSGDYKSNVFRFDGTNWSETAGLPQSRSLAAAVVFSNLLWSIGGYNGTNQANVYYFDGTNWSETTSLPISLRGMGAGVVNGSLYAFGGFSSSAQSNTYVLTFATLGVNPDSGSCTGGYQVTISGTNLCNGSDITNVTLCGASVSNILSQSATQIVIVAGTGGSGLGDVRVYSTSYGETVKSNAFTYLKADKNITFPAISDQIITSSVHLAATASSGLPVSFSVRSGPGTITGNTNLTFTATGTVSLVASQAGNTNWNPAPAVTNTFNVLPVPSPTENGWLAIQVTPANGSWQLSAPFGYTGPTSGTGSLSAVSAVTGQYGVSYGALSGYVAPSNQTGFVAAGNTTLFTAVYLQISTNIGTPSGVNASEGTYTNKIRVTWQGVSGATGYQVWRSQTNDANTAGRIADIPENSSLLMKSGNTYSYDDYNISPIYAYYYWVRAKTSLLISPMSYVGMGYAALSPEQATGTADIGVSDFVYLPVNVTNLSHAGTVSCRLANLGPDVVNASGVAFDFYMTPYASQVGTNTANMVWIGTAQSNLTLNAGEEELIILTPSAKRVLTVRGDLSGTQIVKVTVRHLSTLNDPNLANNTTTASGTVMVKTSGVNSIGRGLNDYDGDGKADGCLYQSVLGRWYGELSGMRYSEPVWIGDVGTGWRKFPPFFGQAVKVKF